MVAPAASGIFKQIRIGVEATYGVAPSAGGTSQILRRVNSTINPDITTFKSNEIQPDRQLHTFRHGTQTVRGTLRGELSPDTYRMLFGSLFAGTGALTGMSGGWSAGAVSSINSSSNTITYAAGVLATSPGTITRTSGSWITDGLKIGDVIQVAGSSVTANNARNYRITNLTATIMSVGPTPPSGGSFGNEVVTAGTDTSGTVTFTVMGSKLLMPDVVTTTLPFDPSFTLEEYFPDQAQSELYVGCKPTEARISITPSALSTVDFNFLGHSFSVPGSPPYFTSPTAVTTYDATTGVSGLVRIGASSSGGSADQDLALVTAMQLNIMGGHTIDPVIGNVFSPFVFPGIIDVSGSVTLLFYDETFFNFAINETVVDIYLMQTLGTAINANFLSIKLENVKLNSVTKDDGPKAVIGTYNFAGIKFQTGGAATAHDNGTIVLQDSTFTS